MPDTAPAYYAVTVTNSAPRHRGTSLCWSRQFTSAAEAGQHGKAEVDAGRATLAFIVAIEDGHKRALPTGIYPTSARRIISHWIELEESLSKEK